jgi:hypothetical protein
VALYVVAIVVVAVGAGLAARSGPEGAETVAGTTLATAPPLALAPRSANGELPTPPPAARPNVAVPILGPAVATPVVLPVGVAPPGREPPGTPTTGPSNDGGAIADPAEPAAGVEPAMAVLAINTEPWTRVEIDGASAGTTPVIGRRVRPGRHSVRLTNPARGISRTVSVTLRAGAAADRPRPVGRVARSGAGSC